MSSQVTANLHSGATEAPRPEGFPPRNLHPTQATYLNHQMSRLASLKGPSSPSPNPVKGQKGRQSPAKSPTSKREPQGSSLYDRLEPDKSSPTESTYHRKLRTYLLELKVVVKTWNDLVLVDGVKAAKGLVDARTELDNSLAALPSDVQPRLRLVTPKLAVMDARLDDLQGVLLRLHKQFRKMSGLVDAVESLVIEAAKTKGWTWVSEEPLWFTWSLERFGQTSTARFDSKLRLIRGMAVVD
ncbi:hypothetical protein FS837_012324 [Tulasnella sp. UAMH 9824]|nr:hypothetical protein FS837_012324 [Tulasnella sp. UAMH 9824]